MTGGFCSDRFPRCPAGHRLHASDAFINEAIDTCAYRADKGGTPCGQRVYAVKLVRYAEPRGSQSQRDHTAWFVVPISAAVYHRLKSEPSTWMERLAMVQATLPNVEEDLAHEAA